MNFLIQASNPKIISNFNSDDETLDEAIESIYPLLTESAIIVWNKIYIPLSYKYDISVIIFDAMKMIEILLSSEKGAYEIHWPSNTFSAIWRLTWDNNQLVIKSKWNNVLGNLSDLLNSYNELKIDKYSFVNEWGIILKKIIIDLNKTGYNKDNLSEIKDLIKISQNIQGTGILYNTP